MVSLRGQKKLEPRPDPSPLGVQFKISDERPHPFHLWRPLPPPPPSRGRTHFKPTETFQYTHFSFCHPQGVKKGFIKVEALRLLRTNSSKIIFEENITNFKAHLLQRGYREDLINTTLSEVNFKDRKLALQQKQKINLRILPFVTQ